MIEEKGEVEDESKDAKKVKKPLYYGDNDPEEEEVKMLQKTEQEFFEMIASVKAERSKCGNLPGSWGTAASAVPYMTTDAMDKSTLAREPGRDTGAITT